ncbi:MAG: heme-binding protein [Paracoccaceae bacterium]|nr:heme-binding protein [Paracoccaceae bacterium]
MMRVIRLTAAAVLAGAVLAAGAPATAAELERPTYAVVKSVEQFEIRDYDRMVIAQFSMRGSYRKAVSQGYLRLERYFTGENSVPEPIAWTVPVMVRDDLASGWTTIFYMPANYLPESAPIPNDQRIRLIEMPPRQVAAIIFPGKLNERVMRAKVAELKAWLVSQGFEHKSDFTMASYEVPWKPGRWRKNEIIVTLR